MIPHPPISPEIMHRIDDWLNGPYDEASKSEIRAKLQNDPQELIDAFFTDLSFGTGGLRGLMGIGTTRINSYTIQIATQGLANYLLHTSHKKLSVFIGFDSRHHSREFAEVAATVLAGNGIHVYLLPELRPTPYISFGCRAKNCDAGIMITASHNPKEYNGYKVYGSDGAQVVHPHDTGIMQEVALIQSLDQVKRAPLNNPLIEIVDLALDAAYLKAIRPLQHFPRENQREGASIGICYTSLHGTGITIVPQALKDWGFSNIHLVEEQVKPDGDFPTVHFPNPEYPEALALGIKKMIETRSNLLIANDPDADRIGVVALHAEKQIPLNGNEIAAICVDYLCEVLSPPPPQGTFITTIVTTELIKKIATFHHLDCVEVLTGFKYIGEKIHEWETSSTGNQFIFGAEESYGYLLGTHARDKDAIIMSCLIAEIALYAKRKDQTLVDRLHLIYRRHGIYREKQHSLNFKPGLEGMKEMTKLMSDLRTHLPQVVGGQKIVEIQDYQSRKQTEVATGHTQGISLPQSDVLSFRLEDQTRLIIRPSGTEPKIKIYASTSLQAPPDLSRGIAQCDARLDQLISSLQHDLVHS
jgi:phosphoglucomutase/phosphomannomutase